MLNLGNTWDTGELAPWLWKLGDLPAVPERIADPYRLIMTGASEAAARMWAERGYPYERAIALWHGGTEARLQALEILEDLGAKAVADRLRRELRADGVSLPRRRAPRHPRSGLTERQFEVLTLLAEGLSNAEIADRLFLSQRTVEHHVEAVLGKLGAPNRQDAVAKAANQGLLRDPDPLESVQPGLRTRRHI